MRFQHYSMAGAVTLVGCSIFALAGAVVFSALGSSAQAGVGSAAPAVAAAAVAQGGGEPTIVWYGVSPPFTAGPGRFGLLFRAWSDGRIEAKAFWPSDQYSQPFCGQPLERACDWIPFSTPNDGLAAFADITSDESVDGVDLAQVLSNWGPAPRNDIPPSDCPLNLVNP